MERFDEPADGGGRALQIQDVWVIVRMHARQIALACAVGAVLAVLYAMLATPMYQATAKLYISPVVGQELKTDKVVDNEMYLLRNRNMFEQTQLQILRSHPLLEEVIRRYTELGHTDIPLDEDGIAALDDMIVTRVVQGTELLEIGVVSPDPQKSALLANLVAEVYEFRNLDDARGAARGAKGWVDGQLVEWRGRIDESAEELLAFQRDNDMAGAEERVTALSAKMESLNVAYGEANTERVVLETTLATHEKLVREGKYHEVSKDMDTPLVKSLTQDYADAVTEHARLSARYGEEHPKRIAVASELERIDAELRGEVDRTLKAERARLELLRAREASLTDAIRAGNEELLQFQSRLTKLEKLQVELDRAKQTYSSLAARLGEVELLSQTQLNNVRVVEPARVPRAPVSPAPLIDLVVGLVLGFSVGTGVAVAREVIDDTITSPTDVAPFLRVPLLGSVPLISDARETEERQALSTIDNPRSPPAEAIRAVRTMLELDPAGQPPRSLLVTSALSSEGKTSVAVLLAVSYAQLGRKVLLVDADLRRPRIHKLFGFTLDDGGLGPVLQGGDVAGAIRQTRVASLDVLPAGRAGNTPNELLASRDLRAALEHMKSHYDMVIVDSPPSLMLADARVMSANVDGVLVVVRQNVASRHLVRECVGGLRSVGARVYGVVFNGLNQRADRYGYYYYGAKYTYGAYGLPDAPATEPPEAPGAGS